MEIKDVTYDEKNQVIVINGGECFVTFVENEGGGVSLTLESPTDCPEEELRALGDDLLKLISESVDTLSAQSN